MASDITGFAETELLYPLSLQSTVVQNGLERYRNQAWTEHAYRPIESRLYLPIFHPSSKFLGLNMSLFSRYSRKSSFVRSSTFAIHAFVLTFSRARRIRDSFTPKCHAN